MNRLKTISLLLCLASLLGLAAIVSQRVSAEEGKGKKIAFVNAKLVIDGLQKTLDFEEKIEKDRVAGEKAITIRRTKIEEMRKALDLLRPGSTEHAKITTDIFRETALLKCGEDALQRDIQLSLLRATNEIYHDIIEYCVEFRKQEGYAAILKIEGSKFESETKGELILKINTRAVLASEPSLDMTEEVIAGLNKKYKK